jgi:hypothetical protein
MKKFTALMGAALFCLAGCAYMDNLAGAEGASALEDIPQSFSEFNDVPIPTDSAMIMKDTSIFGRDNNWIGTLSYSIPYSVYDAFDFYMAEMPKFGWTEITSVRGHRSVLNFTRRRRVVLIMLDAQSSSETMAQLIMAPAPVNISRGIDDQKKMQSARMAAYQGQGASGNPESAPASAAMSDPTMTPVPAQ